MAKVIAAGPAALVQPSPRIITLLKAVIVQVVGIASAPARSHRGSKSSGHQHPPIADIASAAIAPIGSTASRVLPMQAITRLKAAAANEIAAAGISSAHELRPS